MGPVRMISSGHELTTDYDEKTLHELGFKDMQVLPMEQGPSLALASAADSAPGAGCEQSWGMPAQDWSIPSLWGRIRGVIDALRGLT